MVSAAQTHTSGLLAGLEQRNSPTAGRLLLTFWTKGALAVWGLPGTWALEGTASPRPSTENSPLACYPLFSSGLELCL